MAAQNQNSTENNQSSNTANPVESPPQVGQSSGSVAQPATNEQTPQGQPVPQTQQNSVQPSSDSQSVPPSTDKASKVPKMPKMPAMKVPNFKIPKAFIFGAIGLVVLLIVVIVLSMVFLGRPPRVEDVIPNGNGTEASPTPTPQSQDECIYCDDPDIIQIQEDLEEYDKKLRDVNLREETLRIPTLEWNVNF